MKARASSRLPLVSLWGLSAIALTLASSGVARASEPHLVILQPGYPGSTREAEPFVASLLKEIRAQGGPALDGGEYHNEELGGLKRIRARTPVVGIVSLGVYLKYREALRLRALVWSRPDRVFHVLVRKGGARTLAELKGKSLTGTPFQEPEFVRRILFGEAASKAIAESWSVRPAKSFSRAVRDLRKGRRDAAILSALEYRGLQRLGDAEELQEIHKTVAYPQAIVVTCGDVDESRRDALAGALKKLKTAESGREVLKTMGVDGFEDVNPKILSELEKKFGKLEKTAAPEPKRHDQPLSPKR